MVKTEYKETSDEFKVVCFKTKEVVLTRFTTQLKLIKKLISRTINHTFFMIEWRNIMTNCLAFYYFNNLTT